MALSEADATREGGGADDEQPVLQLCF